MGKIRWIPDVPWWWQVDQITLGDSERSASQSVVIGQNVKDAISATKVAAYKRPLKCFWKNIQTMDSWSGKALIFIFILFRGDIFLLGGISVLPLLLKFSSWTSLLFSVSFNSLYECHVTNMLSLCFYAFICKVDINSW